MWIGDVAAVAAVEPVGMDGAVVVAETTGTAEIVDFGWRV